MNQSTLIGLLHELIAIDSTSGQIEAQRHLQAHVATTLLEHDNRLTVSTSPAASFPWTLVRTEAAGPYLVFACHVDTVPVGNENDWDHPPFSPIIRDGLIYGRGTVDMKGGLVAAASALLQAASHGKPVALLMTSDEEIGSLGAPDASASLTDLDIGAVIIPEATENKIITGHRGALWLEAKASGRAAHGSTPERGENAALKLTSVLERARTQLPLQADERLGSETWNLGMLSSGTAPNIVPAAASAIIDIRTVNTGDHLLDWWQAQTELAAVDIVLRLPALRTDPENPWLQALPAEVSDKPAPYFTDGSILSQSLPATPVVVWGPGAPSQMHALNEHLPIQALETATRNFRSAVQTWQTEQKASAEDRY